MTQLDHTAFLAGLPTEVRTRLTERRDTPALLHLAGHIGLIVGLSLWVALGWQFWPLALLPLGVTLNFLFMLHHECTHFTPFKSRWINLAAGHATGFILFQPFGWFTAYHMAHHRHTNDPEHDPELAEPKPQSPRAFLAYALGAAYWQGKLIVLWRNAFGTIDASYVSPRQHSRVRREAQLMLAGYALLVLVSLAYGPLLFWVWLLPLVIGAPFLRLYLLAEHERCPHVSNMFDNNRTTLTNRFLRWLAWNMPYHAEHHAWPQVPFHNLGKVHALARPHLRQTSPGYAAFTRGYVQSLPNPNASDE